MTILPVILFNRGDFSRFIAKLFTLAVHFHALVNRSCSHSTPSPVSKGSSLDLYLLKQISLVVSLRSMVNSRVGGGNGYVDFARCIIGRISDANLTTPNYLRDLRAVGIYFNSSHVNSVSVSVSAMEVGEEHSYCYIKANITQALVVYAAVFTTTFSDLVVAVICS